MLMRYNRKQKTNTNSQRFDELNLQNKNNKTGHGTNVAKAVGNNLVLNGVLQIRRTKNIYLGNNHTLKRGTTMTRMNGVKEKYSSEIITIVEKFTYYFRLL